MMPDGTLYVGTADMSSGNFYSSIYKADPNTFELTYVGPSSAGYTDIAPAPHIRGGALAAVYDGNVLFVNTSTGDYYYGEGDIFYMFQNSLVGIAYAGSMPFTDYGYNTVIDWYFIIDNQGFVYLMGWLEQDGKLYYLEHPDTTGGIYTVIPVANNSSYFCSAHFDGEYLFYSSYDEQKDTSTLYAIDTMGNHKCYELGNFGTGVWPVGGLMELGNPPTSDLLNVELAMEPKAVEGKHEVAPLAAASKQSAETVSDGGLTAIIPQSSGEYEEEQEQVTVKLTGVETAPNGMMTVTYDPSVRPA